MLLNRAVTLIFILVLGVVQLDDIKKGLLCQLFGGTNKSAAHERFRYAGRADRHCSAAPPPPPPPPPVPGGVRGR